MENWRWRGVPFYLRTGKSMSWVAINRGLRLADKRSFPAERQSWMETRDAIYEETMEHGWNPEVNSVVQSYASESLDSSNLVMPLVFLMSPTDSRMLATLGTIIRSPKDGGLVSNSLVYRYNVDTSPDGLTGNEGTFNMCSFWLVEVLTRAGRTDPARLDQARLMFEKMLAYANHFGLYAEVTGSTGEALGNFPLAFTHLSLIRAAFNLDRTLGNRP
ncbi:MAG TPA: hypothetical protein DDY93_10610 [Dehalococcoidia bacterium]|nr:hypothetical protein [Dehalococcoidia bacterium]